MWLTDNRIFVLLLVIVDNKYTLDIPSFIMKEGHFLADHANFEPKTEKLETFF